MILSSIFIQRHCRIKNQRLLWIFLFCSTVEERLLLLAVDLNQQPHSSRFMSLTWVTGRVKEWEWSEWRGWLQLRTNRWGYKQSENKSEVLKGSLCFISSFSCSPVLLHLSSKAAAGFSMIQVKRLNHEMKQTCLLFLIWKIKIHQFFLQRAKRCF